MMYRRTHRRIYSMRNKRMEVTKREVIASVVIVALMLIVGFIISGKISDLTKSAANTYISIKKNNTIISTLKQ